MTVNESKALKKGTCVYWRGNADDSGIITETSYLRRRGQFRKKKSAAARPKARAGFAAALGQDSRKAHKQDARHRPVRRAHVRAGAIGLLAKPIAYLRRRGHRRRRSDQKRIPQK